MATRTDDVVALARVRRLARSGTAKSIRVSAGLSLAELGSAVVTDETPNGVGPVTVYRWEACKRSPHGELAIAYLAALDALMAASE